MAIIDDIHTHSDEVDEILGTPPNWLIKYGSLVLLVIFILLGYAAYFFTYPESITEKIIITSEIPPKKMVNENSGTISDLLVEDGDTVVAGQILLVFRNQAKFEDILSLNDQLLSVRSIQNDSALAQLYIPNDLILGRIQEAVYRFKEKQKDFLLNTSQENEKLSISQLKSKIKKSRRSISFEKKRRDYITRQLKIVNDRYISAQNKFERNQTTLDPVRELKEKVLQLERELQETTSAIRGYRTDIEIMNNEIKNLQSGSGKSHSQASDELALSFSNLQNEIEQWEKKNLIEAPTNGIVVFVDKTLSKNQFIPQESKIMIILPTHESNLVGRVNLNLKGSGKVKEGQKAIVKLDSYPFETFGAILGVVKSKGKVAYQNTIPLEISFPKGLETTSGRIIELNQEMTGTVEIITDNKKFIKWIFQK